MFIGYSTVSSVVVLWLMLEYFFFPYLIRTVVFINWYRSLDCCTLLSGKVFLQILLLCYNRTNTFLVTEYFLTPTIVMEISFLGFVILLVKLLERLTCISLFCPLFFHSLWLDLVYNVDVSTFSWVLTLFWYFVLYCFCSACCDHCEGSWVTVLVYY